MLHRFASHATWGVVGVLMLLLIALPFAGCGSSSAPPPAPPDDGPDDDGIPDNMNPDTAAEMLALWATSGHANFDADAFRHWDEDGEIQISCARCHSTPGFRDYIGADGSAMFEVNAPAALGTTVNCDACHNSAADALDEVHFPSGAIATGLGAEARCMTCHQGRESTTSLDAHIALAEIAGEDAPDADLSFRNIHYFAAGATLYGGSAKGAYQYDESPAGDELFYDARNPHVKSLDTCIECHNPHSLERRIDRCADCHKDRNGNPVSSDAALRDIRMAGSVRDYDCDGDDTEGIFYEIETMTEALYAAIQEYATNVLGAPIIYEGHSYPYFFKDTNGNGNVDPGEAIFPNRYTGWSARLLKAAYNYQYAQKDPGAFAHNPKYVIEFLYDSLSWLDDHAQVSVPNMATMFRNDSGHFDAGARAFRRWDRVEEEGEIDRGTVSTSCARCHSPGGFDFWAEWGLDVTQPQDVGDGFRCEQCHVEDADFGGTPAVKYIDEVEFPGGVTISNDPGNADHSFLCMSCHKGREGGATVEADIQARLNDGNPATNPRFRNIHYLPAGATLYGGDGGVGYQYPAKTYAVKWNHFQSFGNPGGNSPGSQCVFCHLEDHTFLPQVRSSPDCRACHSGATLQDFRIERPADYNGNGNNTEQLKDEIAGLAARLWTALVDYETNTLGGTLTLLPGYPYYSATVWDAKLSRAIFNYQFWSVEHGAWAHNTNYIAQLLYDSIEDLGGNLDFLDVPGRPLIIPPP